MSVYSDHAKTVAMHSGTLALKKERKKKPQGKTHHFLSSFESFYV